MKIPKEAKKIFTGVIFDVYQWEQKLYNETLRTFEMVKRAPAVDIIVVIDNKIMVLDQEQPVKPPFPSLPGGRIDDGESPLDAAKRELLEETGYESDEFELIREYNSGTKTDYSNYLYLAKGCTKKTEQNLDGGEKISVRFVSFVEFMQLCRNTGFTCPLGFIFEMYECLIDVTKMNNLKKEIGIN